MGEVEVILAEEAVEEAVREVIIEVKTHVETLYTTSLQYLLT
ncbi:hypothetical protein PL9214720109 [Planktothrix tepida PCC 9214]|uniref:Uncharacterized protein n=1 Tax=Planktothrix tepida PCC 9214 TaxID=671072 RepID=A0A1J1LTW6_9CYAN|nr:hypothetical protein PL9214720109 [Planktothrix tepida PCC 9214]